MSRKRTGVWVVVAGLLAIASPVHADLYLQGYEAKRHDRFYSGADRAFIGEAFDWSGVGQAGGVTWATMISPTYFVSANHYHPGSGSQLTFYENDTKTNPHVYTVDSWSYNNGDLFLGRLTAPIPEADHITFYPILSLPSQSDYLQREIWLMGKPYRVGRNRIDSASGSGMSFRYDTYASPNTLGADEAYLVGGDSGGPTFTVVNGELALLGTHYWNSGSPPPSNGWSSGDSFVPYSIDWLKSHIVGEQVTLTTDLPEPMTAVLFGLGSLGLLMLVRRRRSC